MAKAFFVRLLLTTKPQRFVRFLLALANLMRNDYWEKAFLPVAATYYWGMV
jgi:hypothetical protein